MFDVAPTELLLVAVVALVVIGPKDLPRAMRVVGQWVGRARGMARHFRSGIDEMIRQSELQEMEAKWREENERIMREFPTIDNPITLPGQSPAVTGEAAPAMTALAPPSDIPAEPSPDLANWHAAADAVPEPVEAPAPAEPVATPPPVAPAATAPAATEPAEEQLSLLPPDPSSSTGSDKPVRP